MLDDSELLRRFAENHAENVFEELVRRHVDFVYGVAYRMLQGDAHSAADVTQYVFVEVALRAAALSKHLALKGWMYQTTRNAVRNVIRAADRRIKREKTAEAINAIENNAEPAATGDELAPIIDDALAVLKPGEREAVFLRFYEGRKYPEIARRYGISADAVRLRVERALEKMREELSKSGIQSTPAALTAALTKEATARPPPQLVASITVDEEALSSLAAQCARYEHHDAFSAALGMYSDIRRRKQTEAELHEAREQLRIVYENQEKIVAMLSHELRISLNPILLLATADAKDPKLPDGIRKDLVTIAESARHEARLIDDLLDLSRIKHGKLAFEMRRLDLRNVLAASVAAVRPTAEAKGLTLRSELSTEPLYVEGDSSRLRQVFCNILNNAVKFTPERGKIMFDARLTEGGRVRVTCSDTGIGMNPAEIERVFECFTQGDHAQKGGSACYGGLGLGLALCCTILEPHTGSIAAASEGPGRGTTLTVELPYTPLSSLQDDEVLKAGYVNREHNPVTSENLNGFAAGTGKEKTDTSTSSRDVTTNKRQRVLLVEDHASTRAVIRYILGRKGFEVIEAGSVAGALSAAAAKQVDWVLCDLGLPDGNGCALMSELSEKYGLKGIALTGFGHSADIEGCQAAGFAMHLTKPVDIHALEVALTAISERA